MSPASRRVPCFQSTGLQHFAPPPPGASHVYCVNLSRLGLGALLSPLDDFDCVSCRPTDSLEGCDGFSPECHVSCRRAREQITCTTAVSYIGGTNKKGGETSDTRHPQEWRIFLLHPPQSGQSAFSLRQLSNVLHSNLPPPEKTPVRSATTTTCSSALTPRWTAPSRVSRR